MQFKAYAETAKTHKGKPNYYTNYYFLCKQLLDSSMIISVELDAFQIITIYSTILNFCSFVCHQNQNTQ